MSPMSPTTGNEAITLLQGTNSKYRALVTDIDDAIATLCQKVDRPTNATAPKKGPTGIRGTSMKDILVHLEKLRSDAAEYLVLSSSTDDQGKRQLFAKMAKHLTVLADEVQREVDRMVLNDGD